MYVFNTDSLNRKGKAFYFKPIQILSLICLQGFVFKSSLTLFAFLKNKDLFICSSGCTGSSWLCTGSHRGDFSSEAQALGRAGSVAVAHGLKRAGSPQARDRPSVLCIAGQILNCWATREAPIFAF